jgi:hypothetical protein
MATSYGNIPIVTSGLTLCLDAGNLKSYPTTGTTWTDLSKNGNNGTLVNMGSTGFSSSNVGVIVFDRVNDYVTVSSSSLNYGTGDFTWDVWVNLSSSASTNNYILDHGSNGGTLAFLPSNTAFVYYNVTIGVSSPLYTLGFGGGSLNTWYNLIVTRISGTTYLYKDGLSIRQASDTHNYPSQNLTLGMYGALSGNFYLGGMISSVKLYKGKGFTSSEVLQNYNATKWRFQ